MIDIIIPAYNAHKTIKQTLLSICMQSISPLVKVYIIDDKSAEPYDYLKDLFKDKLLIEIIRNKENSGPGVCRNVGLNHSSNPYIFFIDSDDTLINYRSLENLFNAMEKNQADIVAGSVGFEEEDGEVFYITNHERCLHGKLYSRAFINKYSIRFNSSSNHEDNAFHNLLLMGEPRVVEIDNKIYFYRYNHESITKKDPKYRYKSLLPLATNSIWVAVEAEKREFNKYLIAKYLFANAVFIYYVQMNYLDEPDLEDLYRNISMFITLYLSYDKFLDVETKHMIFNLMSRNYIGIPTMTFFDFIDRVTKPKKK